MAASDQGALVRLSLQAAVRAASVSIIGFVAACASGRHTAPAPLSPEFQGVWANIGPQAHNWWDISATQVVMYGFGNTGACESMHGEVVDPESAEVRFGTTATGTLHRQGDLLLFVTDAGNLGLHQRVEPASICRKPDGSYAEGAPQTSPLR